jgi:hypothetical protein
MGGDWKTLGALTWSTFWLRCQAIRQGLLVQTCVEPVTGFAQHPRSRQSGISVQAHPSSRKHSTIG